MRLMSRRKFALFGLAAAVLVVAVGLLISYYGHSKTQYAIFAKNRELFEAVREETEHLVGEQDDLQNIGDIFLFTNGGNAAIDQFHESVSSSLQGKIQQIVALSGDDLSFLRYSKQDGKSFLRFVFDWERTDGGTYHIVYCESRDMVKKLYDGEPVGYVLDELGEGWYGIRIK